jgi:hypothetical protein
MAALQILALTLQSLKTRQSLRSKVTFSGVEIDNPMAKHYGDSEGR